MPLLAKGGLLSTPPQQLSESMWPEALRGSALVVYALAEPVVATGSLLDALARPHRRWIFSYNVSDLQFAGGQVEIADTLFQPRSIVFAAGEGNAELMRRAGIRGDLMQRRPLKMVLLRGTTLPVLFGHCIMRGKTQVTITTPTQGIWQVGGEIAEQLARQENLEDGRQAAMREVRALPTWAGFLGCRDRYLLSDSGGSKNSGAEAPKWCPRLARLPPALWSVGPPNSRWHRFWRKKFSPWCTGNSNNRGITRSHWYDGRRPLLRDIPGRRSNGFPLARPNRIDRKPHRSWNNQTGEKHRCEVSPKLLRFPRTNTSASCSTLL